MNDLQFAAPEWGYALWGVLLVVTLLVWLERRGGAALGRFVAAPLHERLVAMPTPFARWTHLALLGVAAVALVVALMRPQWGIEFVMSPQVGAEIMIALDVSKSMLAEDVVPNRLERAKAEIRDLLPYLDGDQVGLIAFAGRASVLCPLTPDFSFLRLVLDQVDAGSVSRGGTRLEEPIRKAVAGFGPSGDLARVILLITDGEDHDSFPRDAARDAAERGIRILAIGFGDEAGSRIAITDPRSGARVFVEDAAGRPVISRLDGELLRELAVMTEGAYVPAGTGVLDLESIFEAHIRPLMRGEGEARGKTVRKDGFQWGVLVALLALFGSLLTRTRRVGLPLIVLLLLAAPPGDARAEPAPGGAPHAIAKAPDTDALPASVDVPASAGDASATPDAGPTMPADPREAYNAGLEAFESGELDPAQTLFEAARGGARGDGELRFRATFNLGWVDVARADALIEATPEEALAALQRAADWFREAIALRPASEDARRNLEIVLARSLALADSLEQRDARDVRARLEELIGAQREVTGAIRGVVERIQAVDDPNAADMMRPAFEAVAVQEREILALAGALNELAGQEQDALEARTEDELTPEERMRKAQLAGVLHYLHRARERIGQARSQLRQRQGERAHRRAAAALGDLERAREQLLDPVQILDGLVRDTALLQRETTLLDQARALPLGAPVSPAPLAPAWLTERYLGDLQDAALERSGELNARLAAGLAQPDAPTDPGQEAVLARVEQAQPLVARAGEHLAMASDHLAAGALSPATEAQREALVALVDARERFLDLKGLIEVAHSDEVRIAALLGEGVEPDAAPSAEQLAELAPALAGLQGHNLERLLRMSPMLAELRAELDAAAADPESEPGEAARAEQAERLELADGILAVTEAAMQGAKESLERMAETEAAIAESRASAVSALKGLESLRRLFFSIVEHIRDAARQQLSLGDQTEAAAGADADRRPARTGPVQSHQAELATRTDALANALHEQSFADPAEILGPDAAKDPETAEAAAARLAQASEHVLAASEAMDQAAEGLADDEPDFDAIRGAQDDAVEKLAEALALLQPEQEQQQQQEQEEQQQQQQEQEQQEQGQQASDEPDEQPREADEQDPTQLLQSVRDREAERHRRNRARSKGYEPVDKDW